MNYIEVVKCSGLRIGMEIEKQHPQETDHIQCQCQCPNVLYLKAEDVWECVNAAECAALLSQGTAC